jgi:hypothetical protein
MDTPVVEKQKPELTPAETRTRMTADLRRTYEGWPTEILSLPAVQHAFSEPERNKQSPLCLTLRAINQLNRELDHHKSNKGNETHIRRHEIARDELEKILDKYQSRPKMHDLGKLYDRDQDLENVLHEAGKDPNSWEEEREDGTIKRWEQEHASITAQIQYIEASPEYQNHLETQQRRQQRMQDRAERVIATMDPEDQKILCIDNTLMQLEDTLHDMGKDGDWHHAAIKDGSKAKIEADQQELIDLARSPDFVDKQQAALGRYAVALDAALQDEILTEDDFTPRILAAAKTAGYRRLAEPSSTELQKSAAENPAQIWNLWQKPKANRTPDNKVESDVEIVTAWTMIKSLGLQPGQI